jgi:hypothetical protein
MLTMNRDHVSKSDRINWFPFLLPSVLGLIAGLDALESIRLFLMYVVCGLPGVFLICRLTNEGSSLDPVYKTLLGAPLGLAIAIGAQQLLVALNFGTFGWALPAVAVLPFATWTRFFEDSKFGSLRLFVVFLATSLLFLADVHWAFLIGASCAVASLVLPKRIRISTLIIGSVACHVVIPKFWYLISNDRLFEESYSRSIIQFGFWDWYGSSSTWVPYHWFAHAIGGLAQTVVSGEPYIGVGIVPIVLAAAIFSGSAYVLVSSILRNESRSTWALVLCPLLGVFALGESNSADLSISFGVWALAIVLSVVLPNSPTVGLASLLTTTVVIVLLTKVSTGLVIVGAVILLLFYSGIIEGKVRMAVIRSGVCVVSTVVVLVTNFDFFGFAVTDDSRSRLVVKFGGFLGLEGAGTLQRILIVCATFIGGILLPLILFRLALRHGRTLSGPVLLAGSLLSIGWVLRLILVSYNNESYLEAALLCSAPILIAAVFQVGAELSSRTLIGTILSLGIATGVFQQALLSNRGSSRNDAFLRIVANSPILFFLVVLVFIGYSSALWLRRPNRITQLSVLPLIAIGLIGSMAGPDTWRIVTQIKSGGVWEETNFGESDDFFFGSSDEAAAGNWLRSHAHKDDIIGTNNICKPQVDCPSGGQTPIAAWSGLRSYLEAERFITGRRVDEVLVNESVPRGFPDWLLERQSLLVGFASEQNVETKTRLRNEGVTWYWLDLRVEGSRLTSNQDVAFRSGPILVLEL